MSDYDEIDEELARKFLMILIMLIFPRPQK